MNWFFDWHDLNLGTGRTLSEGIEARIVTGERVMVSIVRIAPNTSGTLHKHDEEQWGVLLEGECIRYQGDEAIVMQPGNFWCTPGGVMHAIKAGPAGAITLEIFGPPRAAYLTPGTGFGQAAPGSAERRQP